MSIDTLPEKTEQTGTADAYTPDVRNYLSLGVQQGDDAIAGTERHIAELDTERAAAEQRLADLILSRKQLVALVGKNESRDPGEQELPTFVCHCARIAVVDPVLGPIHEVNGTHLPAMEACQMPQLGFLGGPDRAAGGEGA